MNLLDKLKELQDLDCGGKWEYRIEGIDDETGEYENASVGFICPWGGVHVCDIMREVTDASDHAKFIAELHNLLPEIIKALDKVNQG